MGAGECRRPCGALVNIIKKLARYIHTKNRRQCNTHGRWSAADVRPSLITPFLGPKMIVFGSQNRFANRIDPKLINFQAFIFGDHFRVGPYPKMEAQFQIGQLL